MVAAAVPPHPWAAETREYVEAQQERHYRRLAQELGLGDDPAAAYQNLSGLVMPREYVATEKLRSEYGAEPYLSQDQWSAFDREVADLYQRYAYLQPPTRYEDPNRYRSMAMTFDGLHE